MNLDDNGVIELVLVVPLFLLALVVVVNPVDKSLTIHRPGLTAVALREGNDVLDVADVIPGFSCRLSDIFD